MASALVAAVEDRGVGCWLASRDVPVGANYAAEIMAAMSSAAAVVVILSNQALASPHVRREVNHAIGREKEILPFSVDEGIRGADDLPSDWGYWLGLVQIHALSDLDSAAAVVSAHVGVTSIEAADDSHPQQPRWISQYVDGVSDEFGSLENVFTMLRLQGLGPTPDGSCADTGMHSLDQLVRARRNTRSRASITLGELSRPGARWIISGAPGSGKSTLMRFLTGSAAHQFMHRDGPLPLFIDLGRYARGQLLDLSLVAERVRHFSRHALDVDALISLLDDPKVPVLWVMDSLDEALIGRRGEDATAWLEVTDLVDRYPAHAFIVTCRSTHVPDDEGFDELVIREFSEDDCLGFVSRYLKYFDVGARPEGVLDAIPAAVRPIARTPLLLSMMVSLYVSGQHIPDDVSELYRLFVRQVLERIEAARPGLADPYVKDLCLAGLAFEMLVSGHIYMNRRVALGILAARAGQLVERGESASPVPAGQLLEELLYSGLLLDRDGDVGFLHLTLLEYFAQCEMSREYSFRAQSDMDQYFLRSQLKIRGLMQAAKVGPGDSLVELGAGIGSVARHVPPGVRLTLLDLDPDLIRILRFQFPDATVMQADAVASLPRLEFDVLLSNLPFFLTDAILNVLAGKAFRVAVLSVRDDDPPKIPPGLHAETLMVLDEDDFFPRQPFKSRLLVVVPRPGRSGGPLPL